MQNILKIQSINPSTGKLIKEFTTHSAKDIALMVTKAKIAQSKWEVTPLKEKRELFIKLQKLIKKQEEQIVKLMLEETGKRLPDGYAETYEVTDAIEYYYEQVQNVKTLNLPLDSVTYPDTKFHIQYKPHGVLGLIIAWNFPFYVPMMNLIPALYTSNAIIVKSSEYSTMVTLKVVELFKKAGFPKNLVQVAIGADKTGKALVKSDISKIFLVGSIETGKSVTQSFGIKPIQAELGGNSSAIVLNDADVDLAIEAIVWGATYNAGQECVGIKRCFVDEKISKEFTQKIIDKVKTLRAGIDYGPYIRIEALKKVENRVHSAIKQGAQLLHGCKKITGKGYEGYWLTPAVVLHNNDEIDLVKSETFGNVIPISTFKTEKELLHRVNNSEYGLSNAIFTKDTKKAELLAEQIESGMVFVNDVFINYRGWDHWVGWKNSGIEGTEDKLMQFLKKKVVTVNKSSKKRAYWYPY